MFWGDSGEISGFIDVWFIFSGWTHEKLKSLSLRGKTGWLCDECDKDCFILLFDLTMWRVGPQFSIQGSNLRPLCWMHGVLTTGPPGKSWERVFSYLDVFSVYACSVQLVTQPCPTLRDPMNRSTPGLPVHHQLPEFTQIHVHRVSDAIQPSHPLSSPYAIYRVFNSLIFKFVCFYSYPENLGFLK